MNVNVEGIKCALCNNVVENTDHIFLSCPVAQRLWFKVYGWLGIAVVQPLSIEDHFIQQRGLFEGVKDKKGDVRFGMLLFGPCRQKGMQQFLKNKE